MVGNREKILNCQPGISIEQLGDDKFLFDQSREQLLTGNGLFWLQSRLRTSDLASLDTLGVTISTTTITSAEVSKVSP